MAKNINLNTYWCPHCKRQVHDGHLGYHSRAAQDARDVAAAKAALAEPGERKTLAEIEAAISTKH